MRSVRSRLPFSGALVGAPGGCGGHRSVRPDPPTPSSSASLQNANVAGRACPYAGPRAAEQRQVLAQPGDVHAQPPGVDGVLEVPADHEARVLQVVDRPAGVGQVLLQ